MPILTSGSRLITHRPASSWWLSGGISAANCIAAYAPKGAASLAASYSNLSNPGTYDCTVGSAPTFNTLTGWTFNGSSQYLITNVTPQIGWTAIVRYASLGAGNDKALFGVYDGSSGAAIAITGQSVAMRVFAGGNSDLSPRLNSGVYAIANKTPYRNGTAETNIVGGSSTIARAIFIGALNLNGSAAQFGAVQISSFAIYNTALTAVQVPAVGTAMP